MRSYRNQKNIILRLKAEIFFILGCGFICSTSLRSMEAYQTYPTPRFHNVEKICKEILLDINALTFNSELNKVWIEQSDYVLNQFLILSKTLDDLITHKEECRAYLLEDLQYLHELLELVETSYVTLIRKDKKSDLFTALQTIISENKLKLDALYCLNQEIILS